MSLLNYGCACDSCASSRKEELLKARAEWLRGEHRIELRESVYECGDGCCYEESLNVFVNGFELGCEATDPESLLYGILEFLEYKDVQVDYVHTPRHDDYV